MKALLFSCVSFVLLASGIFVGGTQNSLHCYECSAYYTRDCGDPFDNSTMTLVPFCAQCSKGSVQVDGQTYIQRKCLHSKSDDGCERNATNWECLCSDAAGCNGRNTLVAEGAAYTVEASASVMILSAFIAIQHFVMQ
ncbi:uncharacterized protein LOC128239921 [Mya arenaria]|uniref:uncharacterized protein LOC128239921 n=1 Tax=Mya arenaria TaxID=6604 RepID=UPI0022E6D3C1|nr:uncharacterized protein LOC128239921 [Mya arenaria]